MKNKGTVAESLDYISRYAPSEYKEIENLIKYTKKLTEMKIAKKEGNVNVQ